MTDNFWRHVSVSVFGHIALVLLIFFQAVWAPRDRLDIRSAVRVDIFDLPQKIEAVPEKIVEPTPPVPLPEKELPKKVEIKPTKLPEAPLKTVKAPPRSDVDQKRALNKLKAFDALEKIKQDVSKEKAAKAKEAVVRGNQVNAGNALTGLEKIEYDRYFDELKAKMLQHWNIPQWLAEADLKAQVQVVIDERGTVIRKLFRKSSGNEVFDAKVIEAIESSSPLPPPPPRLRGFLSTSGIVFNFPQ